jgi:peroxiredoxin
MRLRNTLLLGIGLLIGLGIGWVIVNGFDGEGDGFLQSPPREENSTDLFEIGSAPRAGALAPDFDLETLSGGRIQLSDLRGRPVLINFWATWCGPCKLEMPAIQAQFDQHSSDLVVLAVNFDEPAEEVQGFADELGLTFDVLLDPGGEVNAKVYQVRGYPSTYFVDRDGMIQAVQIGLMTESQLEEYLKEVGITG